MRHTSAQKFYTSIAVGMTLFIFLVWWYFVTWSALIVYLCAVNVVTLILYFWDKMIAGSTLTRVPEVVLHGLALFGGSPMALMGQKVFRHKTRKASFQAWQYGVLFVQVLLVIGYAYSRMV